MIQVVCERPGKNSVRFAVRMARTSVAMPSTHSTMDAMRNGRALPLRSACISSRMACVA